MNELQKFPEFRDKRGSLVVWENNDLPFVPSRTFIISEVPKNQSRANHAVSSKLFIIPISGSFEIELNHKETTVLDNKQYGLLIEKDTYIKLANFSPAAVALVFAEKPYSQTSYSDK